MKHANPHKYSLYRQSPEGKRLKGSGNTAATAVGAVAGAIVGDTLGKNSGNGNVAENQVGNRVQKCRTTDKVETQQQPDGYLTVLRYGHTPSNSSTPHTERPEKLIYSQA